MFVYMYIICKYIYIHIINQINNLPVSPLLFGIIWSTSARLNAIWKIYPLSLSPSPSPQETARWGHQTQTPKAESAWRLSACDDLE